MIKGIYYAARSLNNGFRKISNIANNLANIQTSNPLHLAISGDGFFALQTVNGTALTRNGKFDISEDGFIVNDNGDKLLGEKGPINLNEFLIDANKEIKILRNGEFYLGKDLIDNLMIMQTDNPSSLQRGGNLNFLSPESDFSPVSESNFQVMQGYLEESNVNPIIEMETMIKTSTDYESSYKMINFLDNSLEKANEIGKV